jgi:hypothetical protein
MMAGVLPSPTFARWRHGVSLDIRVIGTEARGPRLAGLVFGLVQRTREVKSALARVPKEPAPAPRR